MSGVIIYERLTQESEVARRWWQLPPLTLLRLEDGRRCLLIYMGTPGGAAGPDVRDAIVRFLPGNAEPLNAMTLPTPEEAALDTANCRGDIEFHLSASDWFVHQHQYDLRYNSVILHVVFYLDSAEPPRRQDGMLLPNCSLLDPLILSSRLARWPCQCRPLLPMLLTNTLLYAGLLRFHEKSARLGRELEQPDLSLNTNLHAYDCCLLPALAEALGYGRNSAFFRAVGKRLIGLPASLPEPLSHTLHPPSLDLQRLRILRTLITRWQSVGAWKTLHSLLRADTDVKSALSALRAAFSPLSQARTDIILCNVLLPFATAIAEREQSQKAEEPGQACLQQGLHYLYASTCQAKHCQECLCGGRRL